MSPIWHLIELFFLELMLKFRFLNNWSYQIQVLFYNKAFLLKFKSLGPEVLPKRMDYSMQSFKA